MIAKKVGFVGVGNMGMAIVAGLISRRLIDKSHLWIYDKDQQKTDYAKKQFGVHASSSVEELLQLVEVVILAIKPQDLSAVVGQLKNAERNMVFISILAGVSIQKLAVHLGNDPVIVRAMPNLGAQVGEGVTALCCADAKALELAHAIFQGCGKTISIKEEYFDLVTAVSGSGPAYFFLLIESLTQEAKAAGLGDEAARLLSEQTALGAAQLASQAEESAAELRKQVTSKGGTTEAALKVFETNGFFDIVHQAVKAAKERSKDLGKNS